MTGEEIACVLYAAKSTEDRLGAKRSWIEYPARAGAYFVEIGLVDKEGHTVGAPARSVTFHVPA
jgi:hypothetical protein